MLAERDADPVSASRQDVEEWIARRRDAGIGGRTIRSDLSHLRVWYRWLVKEESVTEFEPINLFIRRIGMGLSQRELGALLTPPTTQIVVSHWETGTHSPRDPLSIDMALSEYEGRFVSLVDELLSVAEDEENGSSTVVYPMYATQAEYEAHCPHAQAIPYLSIYRLAVAQVAMIVRSKGQSLRVELF